MATEAHNTIYRVARWNETFETSESRKVKTLTWVALPVDMQSNGYQLMVETFRDEAPTVYGAWCALLAVAAKCHERGTLAAKNGVSYTPERIARLTHFPVAIYERLFKWALSEPVGWLEVAHVRRKSPDDPPECREKTGPTGPDITGQDIPASVGGGEISEELYREIFPFVRSAFDGFKIRNPRQQDARMLLVAATLAKNQRVPKGTVSGIVAQVAESRDLDKPFAVIRKRLNELCDAEGFTFQGELNRMKIKREFLKLPSPEEIHA